jgi:acyl-CoA synthetase (AMP-forming)/AMP-acid ligase II
MDVTAGRTLGGIFEAHARRWPAKTWLAFEDTFGACRRWTYAEFDAWVNQTAHWLLECGIGRATTFTVQAPNTPGFIALAVAASKIGAVMVPADPAATADELGYVVEHSESQLIVGEEPQAAALEEVATSAGAELVYARENGAQSSKHRRIENQSTARHLRRMGPAWYTCSTPRARRAGPRGCC